MLEPAKKVTSKEKIGVKNSSSMIKEIKTRQTEELIIALCGSLGSGTSTIAKIIEEVFSEYNYRVNIIKVSSLIRDNIRFINEELENDDYLNNEYLPKIDLGKKFEDFSKADRIVLLQSAGNALRKKISADVLAQLAIKEIALKRDREEHSDLDIEEEQGKMDVRESRRHVTIIDSLKNPSEAELLELVYRDMFYLFGVLCPEKIRELRLEHEKHIERTKAVQLMIRDKSESEKYGQQLLKTIFHSDFFVRNAIINVDSLKPCIKRYVDIMMGDKKITPTLEENAMFHAHSAAVRSGCLSRQVGASIVDKGGYLISTGCNDVPKAGGGLYTEKDGVGDGRCIHQYGGKCKNDENKNRIFNEIDAVLNEYLKDSSLKRDIGAKIREITRLNGLIEFCRAIHAEMDAIISAARNGNVSLEGAILFCTTFPCHNCARHIVAAGISKVYYIEPYEKSLAMDLHEDAISLDISTAGQNGTKVVFTPFEGVSPRKYLRLFHAEERKKDGVRMAYDQRNTKPSILVLLDTRYEYEVKILDNLRNIGMVSR